MARTKRQVPAQLQVFDDPGRALQRIDRTLTHVETRGWGAVATVLTPTGWTIGAVVGPQKSAERVAGSYLDRTVLGVRAVNLGPALAMSAVFAVIGASLAPGIGFAIPLALLGFVLGVPVGSLLLKWQERTCDRIELDDDLRLLLIDEKDGLLDPQEVGALLKAAVRDDREVVVAAAQAMHEVLVLGRECPPELGVRRAVSDLARDLAADPSRRWPATREALDELSSAVREWRRSRDQLVARADDPVRRLRAGDAAREDELRREQARRAVNPVVEQLRAEARAQDEAAGEL